MKFNEGRAFLRSKKAFISLTASYLLIVLLSLLIGSVGYSHLYDTRSEQLYKDYEGRLGQAVYMADEVIYSARQAMLSMTLSARANAFIYTVSPMSTEDYYNLHLIINEIESMRYASNLTKLFLYVDGIDSVVSDDTRFDTDVFYSMYLKSDEYTLDDFRKTLSGGGYFSKTPSFTLSGGRRYFLYTVTLPLGSKARAAVCCCVDVNRLMNGFTAGGLTDEGHVRILGGDNVIYETEKEIKNGITISRAGKYDIQYSFELDRSVIKDAMAPTRNFILRMYVLEIMGGLIFAIALTQVNYSPLRRLLMQLNGERDAGGQSEYERILSAAGRLTENNNELSERLAKQLPMIRASVLRSLLTGGATKELAGEYGISFPYASNAVLIIAARSLPESAAVNYSVISLIESIKRSGCAMYAFETLEGRVTVIINTDGDAAEAAREILECLCASLSFEPYMALSAESGADLKELYSEALNTLAYARAWGKRGITCRTDMSGSDESCTVNEKCEAALTAALTDGNGELAVQIVRKSLAAAENSGMTGLRINAYSLMNIMMRVKESWRLPPDGNPVPADFANAGSIPEELCRMAEETAAIAAGLKRIDENDVGTRVSRIIELRYSESALSLTDIAEELGLTAPYISTLFKQQTGMGFSDALGSIRLEHSKILLRTTDLPVQEIAEKCGYSGSAYFGRVFKNRFGITPGQYRNEGGGTSPTD